MMACFILVASQLFYMGNNTGVALFSEFYFLDVQWWLNNGVI